MYNTSGSSPTIRNTILWGNTAPTGAQIYNYDAASSPVVSDSVVRGACPAGSTCTNTLTADPRLGTLGDYGGSTQTISLLPGSSAIDAGNDAVCPATDQRGMGRPQGAHCDIGALEYDYSVIYHVYHVKTVASGTGNCQSWANACTLQTALTGATSGDEIWVAAGTYKPTTGTDRTATFQLKDGVALYGGFAGTETARDQRNPVANVTILSGDIDNNDSQTPIITDLTTVTGNTTNSYHVVTGATSATLDGFTITAGYANGASPYDSGAGMFNSSSSPTLANVTFSGNSALNGGGMYNTSGSNPTLANITFSGNSAYEYGGGLFNTSGSHPTLTNVTFSGNSAAVSGGGMYNAGNPALTNVTFSGNSAPSGAGMYNQSGNPTLTNVTFNGNTAAGNGGGNSIILAIRVNNLYCERHLGGLRWRAV
jgi:predicted outer membrane repeat protein